MKSSAASPLSEDSNGDLRAANRALWIVTCALTVLAAISGYVCWRNGWILYYGDAASHLNISRALVDSRTPGYDQLGTVWLPLLHVLCLPLVVNDFLWTTGLAATIPVAACFVVAGTCLYLAALETYARTSAALVAVLCFAMNPNILYLAAIPMTEIVFLAALAFVLLAELRFRSKQKARWVVLGVIGSWALCLTRYDGWFLIPFIAAWFGANSRRGSRISTFLLVGTVASIAPLYWMAHNWYETGNALDFYEGPYSAAAIQGGKTYPGDHDWLAAFHYYFTAGRLCTGWPLLLLGVAGVFFAVRQRALAPLCFLALTPLFYVWSMHSTRGTPIYVPLLWPFSFYNNRYGIAFVPFCAFAAAALSAAWPARAKLLTFLLPLVAILPWIVYPSPENWICWKESEINSKDRRAWTEAAARILQNKYRQGQGILTSTGDVTGIYCRLGIHLSETLNIGNGPEWLLATTRPDLYHPNRWLIMQAGDPLSQKLSLQPARYREENVIISSKFSPFLIISERETSR